MDPKKLFSDSRFQGSCVYCGALPDTRDHVPPKVLLDEPYPLALPVVPCCKSCNNSFSYDEVYVACLIECVIHGTTTTEKLSRQKIKRILIERPYLQNAIEKCKNGNNSTPIWNPDYERVKNLVLKLARGHAAYELSEPQMNEPEHIAIHPYGTISDEILAEFECSQIMSMWPEIGSRAFINVILPNKNITIKNGWNITQDSRYRYMITYDGGVSVKIVISDYLFCEVIF